MEHYLFYLTLCIAILTVALVAQAVVLFLAYRRVNRLADELEKTAARLSEQSAKLMEQAARLIGDVKRHVERYGQVGDDISSRLQHTVGSVLTSVDQLTHLAASGAGAIMREARAAVQGVFNSLLQLGHRPRPKRLPPPDDLLH